MASLDKRVRQQLESWRRELINLTRSNRLLHLKSNLGLQVEFPAPQELFERLSRGVEVYLPPLEEDSTPPKAPRPDEVRFTTPDRRKLVAKLRSLDRNATQSFTDRGVWVLYLAFGQLEWEEAKGSDGARQLVRSPLLLVPVQLKRASASDRYRLSLAEEEQRFNPALLVKLEADFEVALKLPADEEDLTPSTLFDSIVAQVRSRGWKVIPTVLLSTFSFQKEPILKDIIDNEEAVMASALVRGLALGKDAEESFEFEPISESEVDELAPPELTVTILPADATQRRAIASAIGGNSFVMDGPPGTGKSQTIANMIADLLAKRKKVLFVSEKIAALEVVHNRLKEAGLHEFVLEIHSHKTTRKEVARALGRAVQTRVSGKSSMSETDRERLRRRRAQLSEYVEAVNTPRAPLNQTLHYAVGQIAGLQQQPQAPQPSLEFEQIDQGLMSTIIDSAEAIARTWGPIARGDSFLWHELAEGSWSQGRRLEILGLLDRALQALSRLEETAEAVAEELALYPPASFGEVCRLSQVEVHLIGRPQVEVAWLSAPNLSGPLARLAAARGEAKALEAAEATLLASLGPDWLKLESDRSAKLRAAVAELERLAPVEWALRTQTGQQLGAEVQALRELAKLLDDLGSHGAMLASAFDVASNELSAQRTTELAALVDLASRRDLPEPSWFVPAGLTGAEVALEKLRPLAEQLRREAESLSDTFSPDVLDLDLESLCLRFEEVYRGWFVWLNADYRRDRNLLKGVTRSGRLRRKELEFLRDALKWQQAVKAFDTAGAEHAPALGSYWSGLTTDFDRAQSALEVVKSTHALASSRVPTPALQRNLIRGAQLEVRLSDAATFAQALYQQIAAQGGLGEAFLARPLTTASADALKLSSAMERVLEHVRHAEEVSSRAMSTEEAQKCLELRRTASDLLETFRVERDSDIRLFGASWGLSGAPWDNLSVAMEWSDRLRELLGGPVEAGVASTLAGAVVSHARLPETLAEFESATEELAGLFNAAGATSLKPQLSGRLGAAKDFLAELRDSVDDVSEWYAFAQARAVLAQNGMADSLRFCCNQRVPAEQVRPILERAVLETWVDHVLNSDSRLRDVRAGDRNALVAEFRKLDKRLIQLAAFETISVCNDMRPTNIMGQAGVILREAEKQRRHMPVRKLLDKAKDVAQSIKPCLMMSPLSVSQFLPSSMRFDVVIFDEASQVRPADAISSIYRGAQLVVAGDQRQLPPTAFFERMDSDDDAYDEEEPESFESVLDLCKGSGLFTSVPLRWHYRSQHEHLITYSNYSFYDANLLTFPGAVEEADDLGVEVFHVDGVYRRGGQRDNPIEAQKVGERVLFHAQKHPHLTLGVVAFSEAQASTIDAVLDKLADAHPELRRIREKGRLDGLFAKNLETVQGDERDIIIFSMGYGKDENGKFTMNFGPLTKPGGERRLNVAITRARRRVEFVTSVGVSDFTSELASEGGRHLRRYLDFASRKKDRMSVLAIPVTQGGGDFESPFEAEVARVVRSWGHDVVPQVGCAGYRVDLGVRDPINSLRFVLGIECDGAMYHSSKVARDRDRLRQEVLEGLGWRLHRIWGPAWYRNRKEQEDRLKQVIDNANSVKRTGSATPPTADALRPVSTQVVEIDFEHRPEWVATYQTASVYPVNASTHIETGAGKREIQRIARAVVEAEGPVHETRILRAVREAFGIGRAGTRIQASFDAALSSARSKDQSLHLEGGFMWIEGAELSVRVPDPDDPETERSVEEVAPQELELALRLVARDAKSIGDYALMTYVARLFGWDRSGSQITGALGACIRRLVRRQVLITENGRLRIEESNAASSPSARGEAGQTVSDVFDDSESMTPAGEDVQPTPEPAEPEDPAVARFKSCRWHETQDGGAEYCSHRDILPYAGLNGFNPGSWCLDCTFFKVRRAVK